MRCARCKEEFNPHDSVADDMCQDCWEAYCSERFWTLYNAIGARDVGVSE